MITFRCSCPGALAVILVASTLTACGTAPTRFYTLSSVAEQSVSTPRRVAIGIGPITFPQYLDRPQIVTRVSQNRLAVAEFDQWGGNLDDNFSRALASDLASLLHTDRVVRFPWRESTPVKYQITADISSYEADANNRSTLTVSWNILDAKNGTVIAMRRVTYRDADETAALALSSSARGARPYDEVVASMSRNIERLSDDIAAGIPDLRGTTAQSLAAPKFPVN